MKIIIIRSKATDSAIFKVADTLFKNNFDVELLVWDRQNNLNMADYHYKIHNFCLKAPYDKFTALFYLPLWWIYELFFLLRSSYDIIHVCDLDTLWPAIITKFIKKNTLFYTIYDFYAYVVPNGSFQKIRDLIKSFIGYIEKVGIRFTNTLFLVDKSRYNEIKGAKINKLVYIYNSPPDLICKNNVKPNGFIKIFYGGSITKDRGLKYILDAIEQLNDIKLIVAGNGEKEIVENIINNEKTEYLGWLSYNEIILKTLESDFIFRFSDPNDPRTKTASPNKLFEAMMCGKPIIMNSEMEISKIVEEEKCGIIVPYGNVNAIKESIIHLKDSNLRDELGLNGRNAYENKYSWTIMEKRLLNAYNNS